MKRITAMALVVLLMCGMMPALASDGSSLAGNWPDGDFFFGLKFYPVKDGILDANVYPNKDSIESIGDNGLYGKVVLGGIEASLNYVQPKTSFSAVTYIISVDDIADEDARINVFKVFFTEIKDKWGTVYSETFKDEKGKEITINKPDMKDFHEAIFTNNSKASYSRNWNIGDYSACMEEQGQGDGKLRLSILFRGASYEEKDAESGTKPIADGKSATFRNTRWGMTAEEVKATDPGLEFIDSDGTLIVENVKVAGLTAATLFSFDNNGVLYQGGYVFTHEHSNATDFVDDYYTLQKQLVSKYGEPTLDEVKWKNDLLKDDPQNYGVAVSTGQLEYNTIIESGGTKIILRLSGDNYDITLALVYQNMNHAEEGPALDDSGL